MRAERPADLLDPDALLRRPGARLMVLAPHPDDESLAAGGLIQRASRYGVPVDVVFASDGENNPWPQRALERRVRIGPRQRAAWAARRRAEADAALHALGAEQAGVYRLGWPDGGITWMLLDDTAAMLAVMLGLFRRLCPTMLVLPDLVDRHPDHSALHVLVELVLQQLPAGAKPECLGYLLHGRSQPGVPRRALFSLDAGELARKRAAIAAHASQMALSRGRLMRFASATETFVAGLDCHDQAGAALPWSPPWLLKPFLRLLLVDTAGGEKLRITTGAKADLCWRDGSPAARGPRPLQSPYYAKLYCPLPSPWVFDRWGWCRLDAVDRAPHA